MNRLISRLMSSFAKAHKSSESLSKSRKVRLQVNKLEDRDVPANLVGVAAPIGMAAVNARVDSLIATGNAVAKTNSTLAINYFNQAADMAYKAHSPAALEHLARAWASLPSDMNGYTGYAADLYHSAAINASYFWMEPTQGAGSGAGYAYGLQELRSVIRDTSTLNAILSSKPANAGRTSYVSYSSDVAANYVSLLDDRSSPPMAGGTWQVNLGGTAYQYSLTQYGNYASGKITGGGKTGTITETSIQNRGNNWFGSEFTITWSNGSVQRGYVYQNAGNSGQMSVYLLGNSGYSAPFTANRTSPAGFTGASSYL